MRPKKTPSLTGTVEGVLVGIPDSTESKPVKKIHCVVGHGIKGDSHAGVRLADAREKVFLSMGFARGTPIANLREFSAIGSDELDQIARNAGLPGHIPHGALGENLVIRGIPHLTKLPIGTMLFFERDSVMQTTVLMVWGENMTCFGAGRALQKHFPDIPRVDTTFPRHSIGIRGVVGLIFASGHIRIGDSVIAKIPQ